MAFPSKLNGGKRSKEKQMATSNQSKSSSIFIILREALIFLIKNWKPVLIFSLLLFIFSLLSIFKSVSINPILTNLLQNIASLSKLKPPNPDFYQIITVILTELREITIIETIFSVTNFFILSLLLTSTLCFISITYSDNKQPTLKELFSKFRKTWRGVMITRFYISIFIYMWFLMVLLICGFTLVSMNSAGFHVVSFILLILAVILYLYLAMLWFLSLVVAVEEEDIYGLAAIVKGTELLKGRRWKGVLIAGFMILLEMVVCVFPLMRLSSSGMKKMVIFGIFLVVAAVLNVFHLAVVYVFYYECKKRDEGLVLMTNKCGFGYSSLPSEALIDSEIP